MVAASAENTVIKFYTSWSCPYAQRAWIALNHLNVRYDLIESFTLDNENNELVKDPNLLKANPKGIVPTLDVNGEIIVESIDIIEYLHKYVGNKDRDPNFVTAELMKDAKSLDQSIGSSFRSILKKEVKEEQDEAWNDLITGLKTFTDHIQTNGFFKSAAMNVVDITVFPHMIRLVFLETFRQKSLDESLPWVQKLMEWRDRMLSNKAVSSTIADQDNLIEAFRKYLIRCGMEI